MRQERDDRKVADQIAYGKMSDRPTRDAEFVQRVRELAAQLLAPLRVAARECGYALGLHGSVSRDIDLIAVPWAEGAVAPIDLAHALRDAAQVVLGFEPPVGYSLAQARRPHGREGFAIHLVRPDDMTVGEDGLTSSPYIDLSVIPPRENA